MRKLLTIYGQHHSKAAVDLLHVPRKQGRQGLMQLEEAYIVEITKMVEYVDRREDPPIQTVRMHQHNINSTVLQTDSQMPQDSSTERNMTNKGQHSRKNKRKMAREGDTWITAT